MYNLAARILLQVALKTTDLSSEQKSTNQWAIQADLGDKVLDEFHSRIPRMAHEVCLYNPFYQLCTLFG